MGKIKKLLKYFFTKIGNALNLREHERLLNHLEEHLNIIDRKQQKLEDYLKSINMIIYGLQTSSNPLFEEFNIIDYRIAELNRVLKQNNANDIDLINIISYIKDFDFKGKSVVVMGDEDGLTLNKLSGLGASRVKQIKFLSKQGELFSKNKILIYPMSLGKLSIDNFDVLISYNEDISSILLKNNFFNLGTRIKKTAILKVNVVANTVFKKNLDPKIILKEANRGIVYNDNFVRYQLHNSGFNEVSCIYTYGKNINNYFDEKISCFRYKNGFYIKKLNNKFKNNRGYNNTNSVHKIYLANKLPTVKNINKPWKK